MLRRALLSLLPGLVVLAAVFGAPDRSMAGPQPSIAESNVAISANRARIPAARGSLREDFSDVLANVRADQDDTSDDRLIAVETSFAWPETGLRARKLHAPGFIAASHRGCAAPPRGPPIG